jgi:hypothetical protein
MKPPSGRAAARRDDVAPVRHPVRGWWLIAVLAIVAASVAGPPQSLARVTPVQEDRNVSASHVSFGDIGASPFRTDILWAAHEGITSGCTTTRFCPRSVVTREQMASFLSRALDLPRATRDHFADDDASAHEAAINSIAEARITGGCAENRFCPKAAVTRGQMASFLARAFDLAPSDDDFFLDVFGSTHEGPINGAAAAGVTGGCAFQRYCPQRHVTREQMAAFIRRAALPAARVRPVPTIEECSYRLQDVVDAAAAGASVVVPACTFSETVAIRKPMTLRTTGATVDGSNSRRYAFVVSANDVTIDGFEVTRTVNPAQDGAVRVRSANRFTLRNAHIHHTGGACVSIVGGSGHRMLDSELAYCAQQGFHLSKVVDTLVARNAIHHNNPDRRYDPEWEAGAGKAAGVLRVTFESNRVYANRGPGLWCDIDCRDVAYLNNRVYQNERAGIFFEISDGAVISGNRLWENGWRKTEWGWGAGILISSSRNVEITNNIVAWNADGISVISQDRSGGYGWQPGESTWNSVAGVTVDKNVIVVAPQPSDGSPRYALAWLQDWGGVLFRSSSGNAGANNRYWHSQAEPTTRFAWAGSHSRLTSFNATPGEASGRYLSVSERASILESASMPASPVAR